jgi:hypothetical protein
MESELMRIASGVVSVACVALVTLTATMLQAVPLPVDPFGLDGGVPTTWQGTQAYFAPAPVGGGQLKADVDFAVFAPGQFGLSYGGAADPSGGAHYVYAYQVHNTAPGAVGDRSISMMTVGLDGNESPAGIGFVLAGGLAPSSASFIPAGPPHTSAGWSFTGALLAPTMTSEILIFTSPHGPEFDTASLLGGINNTQMLPSPVPEPTSVVLFILGAAALLAVRRGTILISS